MNVRTWCTVFALVGLGGIVACDAVFGDTKQCSTDGDCAGIGGVCGGDGFCTTTNAGASSPEGGAGMGASSGTPAGEGGGPSMTGGPLASLDISPMVVSVPVGQQQTFTVTPLDANGKPPSSTPTVEWSVSGGGTIGSLGTFTAAMTPGGPYTVTAKAGTITATAQLNVTAAAPQTVTMGETNLLAVDDNANAGLVVAQQATLAAPATLQSLTLYIDNAAGKVRLGVYDATGPNNGPGSLKAETDEVVATAGWMNVKVKTPVLLPAGSYWLSYAPESNDLAYHKAGDGTGKLAYFQNPYGPLPAKFSTTPNTENDHWSFYGTLTR